MHPRGGAPADDRPAGADQAPLQFSSDSLCCAPAQPNRVLRSSASAGWRSVLLDHMEGRGACGPFDTHPTPDTTLVVATAGRHRIDVFKAGRWQPAIYQPGAAGLTPGEEITRLRWRTLGVEPVFTTAHLYVPRPLVDATVEEYRRLGRPVAREPLSSLVFQDPAVVGVVGGLLQALQAGEPDLYAEQCVRWLAVHLLSRHGGWWDADDDRRQPAIISDPRLARVIEYMSEHLDRPLGLQELAGVAGISPHHFGRRFREKTGATPHAYLTRLRMEVASRLLRTTDLPLEAIAATCGYTRATAFSTAFSRCFSVSPSRFRRHRG